MTEPDGASPPPSGELPSARAARLVRAALAVAERTPAIDVPIGAVVADASGAVVASAYNEREAAHDPTAHAEVLALRRAAAALGGWRLTGCTLAVTLEPCTMCAGAAVLARVDRVIFGAVDEKAGAVGSLWDVVRDRRLNHRPEVYGPWDLDADLAERCGQLLRNFFRARPTNPPD